MLLFVNIFRFTQVCILVSNSWWWLVSLSGVAVVVAAVDGYSDVHIVLLFMDSICRFTQPVAVPHLHCSTGECSHFATTQCLPCATQLC